MNLSDENVMVALIVHYGFDLGGQSPRAIVRSWRAKYDPSFLPLAVVESLHLGRYKAVSIEQVLNGWQRRGEPIEHFSPEFAEMVSGPAALEMMIIPDEQDLAADIEPEKILFSASEIAEVHRSTDVFDLSDPALDEGLGLPIEPASPVPETHQQVSLDLTPISYPVVSPPVPQDHWQQVEPVEEPPFEPPAQVSQFYYKLRAMAVSPAKEAKKPLPKVPSSPIANG